MNNTERASLSVDLDDSLGVISVKTQMNWAVFLDDETENKANVAWKFD